MHKPDRKNHISLHLRLLMMCLLLIAVLVTGVSLARYLQEFPPTSYQFVGESDDTVVVGGTMSDELLAAGIVAAVPGGWTKDESGAKLEFSVVNASSVNNYASRDQRYTICLLAGLGIEDPDNLRVELCYKKDGKEITLEGLAEEIAENTVNHRTFGDGWTYRFYDEDNEEVHFALPGGELSYKNFTLTIEGNVDPILTELQVNGSYTD